MTTYLQQPPSSKAAKLIHSLTWEQLDELDRSLSDFAGVKLVYLDGTAEVMPISEAHEEFKVMIRRLLETYLDEVGIRFYGRGGPTLGNQELRARNEPDEAYNLQTKKPYPDLVLEVTVTHDGVNKLEGYRRMGIPEAWVWDDGLLVIHALGNDGYERVEQSRLLPNLPLMLFCRYITYYDQYEAVQEFRRELRMSQ